MSTLPPARATAPRRYTSATITTGVVASAACFVIAGIAEVAGVETGSGDMTDLAAVFHGLLAMNPWAWASLGTFAVVLTPAIGLLVTAYEYATVSDRRTFLLAIAVVAILALSAAVAVLR